MPKRAKPIVEKFWSAVEKRPDGCWVWTRAKQSAGYGVLYGQLGPILAHRFSYQLHKGPIPKGLFICHTCDNPPCVNPHHLFIGTARDNVRDCMQKGRKTMPPAYSGDAHYMRRAPELIKRGAEIGTSKLTEGDVVKLLNDRIAGHSHGSLAKAYGIDKSTAKDICCGTRWAHVLGTSGAPTLEQLQAVIPNRKPNARLTDNQVRDIKQRLLNGETGRSIAARYGVHFATISDIRHGKIWRDVFPNIRAASVP